MFGLLVVALVACGSPEPAPTPMPPPPARGKAKSPKPSVRSKAKTGNMVHGKAKTKAKGKAPRGKAPRRPAPIGGAGELTGYLLLEPKEAAEGAKPGTDADMVLAWGEGQAVRVRLGSVPGTCESVAPEPVGPEGQQHTPLWSVACAQDANTSNLYIIQAKNLLVVVRGGGEGKAYKPVRRVPIHPDAKLVRSDGTPPEVAEPPKPLGKEKAAPAPAPAPSPAPAAAPAPAPVPAAPAPVEAPPAPVP